MTWHAKIFDLARLIADWFFSWQVLLNKSL